MVFFASLILHSTLIYATLYYSMLTYATICSSMLFYVIVCYFIPFGATVWYFLLWHTFLYYFILLYHARCYATVFYTIIGCGMLKHFMVFYAICAPLPTPYYAILCYYIILFAFLCYILRNFMLNTCGSSSSHVKFSRSLLRGYYFTTFSSILRWFVLFWSIICRAMLISRLCAILCCIVGPVVINIPYILSYPLIYFAILCSCSLLLTTMLCYATLCNYDYFKLFYAFI